MPRFGSRSKANLKGVDKRIIKVLDEVIQHFDFTVLEGRRTTERQAELVKDGSSKTMKSKHLRGKAVDIAPSPVDFSNTERFCYLAGFIMGAAKRLGYNMRWGRDWQSDWLVKNKNVSTFLDYVHFEIMD